MKQKMYATANISPEILTVDAETRSHLKGQAGRVVWLTGLSGAGKSTIAKQLECHLVALGRHTYVLDGDNLRHTLNSDLGFTQADRAENIRRSGVVAKMMVEAGLIVICAFISPFRVDREAVRSSLADGIFIEIFVDAPLDLCKKRDPKGLYAKAEGGLIQHFTGIDSPYECPESPDLILRTDQTDVATEVSAVVDYLKRSGAF